MLLLVRHAHAGDKRHMADEGNAEARMLIVVRHGDAGDKSTWKGADLRRPLSPLGRRQAEGLVFRLEDYLFRQLSGEGLEAAEPLHWPKGSTWLLQRTRQHVRTYFLAPLTLDPAYSR